MADTEMNRERGKSEPGQEDHTLTTGEQQTNGQTESVGKKKEQ